MSSNDNNDDLEGADIWGDSSSNNNDNNSNNESNKANDSSTSGNRQESQQQQQPEEPAQPEPSPDTVDDDDTQSMSISELRQRIHLIDNDIRVMKSDIQRIAHESRAQKERIRENQEKVKMNKQLPYLVGNVIEVLEPEAEDGESYCLCSVYHAMFCP
jgi:uncharacterized small protein (DUF1192 family)